MRRGGEPAAADALCQAGARLELQQLGDERRRREKGEGRKEKGREEGREGEREQGGERVSEGGRGGEGAEGRKRGFLQGVRRRETRDFIFIIINLM